MDEDHAVGDVRDDTDFKRSRGVSVLQDHGHEQLIPLQ